MTDVRADFTIVRYGNPLAIRDLANESGTMSITNDAENVVAYLHENDLLGPGVRLIYEDTDGTWDELVHDGRGKFVEFRFLRAEDLSQALNLIGERHDDDAPGKDSPA